MKSKPTRKTPAKPRQTLKKLIASAPTIGEKTCLAMLGGPPLTQIEKLAFEAFPLRLPLNPGGGWRERITAQLKPHFTEILFPALAAGNVDVFKALIEAMEKAKMFGGSESNYHRNIKVQPPERVQPGGANSSDMLQLKARTKVKNVRKDDGRKLKLALLSLDNNDLQSRDTILKGLSRQGIKFSASYRARGDAWRHVSRVMTDIGLQLLTESDK
jgi:hypothetical protein